MFLLMASVLSAMARAARRRRMLEEQRRLELERQRRGGGEAPSPFAGMPFGGLLEAMMGGAGGWTHSLEYDERTGRWVEVGSQQPPAPAREPQTPAPANEGRFTRRSPQRSQPSNPLTTLLGGAMGGANSEFRVERPDELVTFADVGGMEPLQPEIRDTVGLIL